LFIELCTFIFGYAPYGEMVAIIKLTWNLPWEEIQVNIIRGIVGRSMRCGNIMSRELSLAKKLGIHKKLNNEKNSKNK